LRFLPLVEMTKNNSFIDKELSTGHFFSCLSFRPAGEILPEKSLIFKVLRFLPLVEMTKNNSFIDKESK
jgi:hypothetical protein